MSVLVGKEAGGTVSGPPNRGFFHSPRRRNHRPSSGAYQPACRYPTAEVPECDIFGKRSEVSGLTRDDVGKDIDWFFGGFPIIQPILWPGI